MKNGGKCDNAARRQSASTAATYDGGGSPEATHGSSTRSRSLKLISGSSCGAITGGACTAAPISTPSSNVPSSNKNNQNVEMHRPIYYKVIKN